LSFHFLGEWYAKQVEMLVTLVYHHRHEAQQAMPAEHFQFNLV
jgi:hypothetical protein